MLKPKEAVLPILVKQDMQITIQIPHHYLFAATFIALIFLIMVAFVVNLVVQRRMRRVYAHQQAIQTTHSIEIAFLKQEIGEVERSKAPFAGKLGIYQEY